MEEKDSRKEPQSSFRGLYRHVKISVKTLDKIIIGGIAAIVILSQGKENSVRPTHAREAVAAFLDGCSYDPQQNTEQILDLALDIWQNVPVLHLCCLPDESAVACLENAILK